MKPLYILLLILIVNASYSQPLKTDRYFIETKDTVSALAPISITRDILEDRKGNIWIMSFQGIIMYDGKVFTNYTLKEKLIHFHMFSVMEDKIGNIWFGSVGGGFYKYDGKSFTLFTKEGGLPDDRISCFMEDRAGNIWIGTDNGVSRYDTSAAHNQSTRAGFTTMSGLPLTSKKGFTNYSTSDGLCGDMVNSIIQDKSGKIWIATRSSISCYDGKSFTDFKNEEGMPFKNVRCIKEDKGGKIWIGGEDGLYCYNPSATGNGMLTKLMANFISYVFQDKAGNIWLSAVEEKGMAMYKYDMKSFAKILEKKEGSDSQIFEITEDKTGNIWFGKFGGVGRFDGKSFNYFTE
ncbi:MAG: histidine kinase [Bacteroidetes bacterium]|jgi:ligand-binding sensor domain-containing protein|nr:histidine kinase [Bacteroidota bacterium]